MDMLLLKLIHEVLNMSVHIFSIELGSGGL